VLGRKDLSTTTSDRQERAMSGDGTSRGQGTHQAGGSDRASARIGDGIRQGIGVLSALKDALEETIQEARERGDLSTERAREVLKEALATAQSAAGEARGRLDFAQQGDLEALASAVESIGRRVAVLEAHVFGAEPASGAPQPHGPTEPSRGAGRHDGERDVPLEAPEAPDA
jgi:polyhydroxyalkanoate synthesis regulator phasin